MIQFPETAQREWQAAAAQAFTGATVREKIERDTRVANRVEDLRIQHEAKLLFQQELDADTTPTLEMMTLQDYLNNPASAPSDLIDGVMKRDGLTVVLGPSGSGKSTLALQMVHSLSTGTPWLGQNTATLSGAVGLLSYDMDASMLMDWTAGFPGVDPSKIFAVNAYKRGNPIGVPALRTQIAAAWKAANVEVVVLDSFSASFFGHDQNDAAATMAHYRDMKLFALTEVGAKSLIVIAHAAPGSPGRARGSTAHHDTADTIVSVTVDPDTKKRTVGMVKYRAARGFEEMSPVIITKPDDATHMVSVDILEMNMKGLPVSPALTAALGFPPVPPNHEEPDIEDDNLFGIYDSEGMDDA